MYKPKSPMGSNKVINFSPSPQSRRKINNTKTHNQQSGINLKPRSSINMQLEQKSERKSIANRKIQLKNIQTQTKQFIDSFKIKESSNINQTPKFCVKPDTFSAQSKNQYGNGLPYNFFSFGQKHQDKLKTDRKIKDATPKDIKQMNKSPKQVKKKCNQMGKVKQQISSFQTTNRNKKTNQTYIR